MAHQETKVTRVPKELISEFTLTREESYLFQNTGEYEIAFAEIASAPSDGGSGPRMYLYSGEKMFWEMDETLNFYVWTEGAVNFESSISVIEGAD